MIFRNIVLAAGVAVAALAAGGGLRAADLPIKARVAPPAAVASSGWAGPYIGLFGGYGFGRARATEPTDPNLFFPFYNGTDVPYSFEAPGFFAGATVGFNMQSGGLVYGLEGEAGYLGLRGSLIDPSPPSSPISMARSMAGSASAAAKRCSTAKAALRS
jgi:outer membrane immunogenic protein